MPYRENVASILQHETRFAILDWLTRVNAVPCIIVIPLSAEERCGYLPEMFHDIVIRLREPSTRALVSDAALKHGAKRRRQGYTAPMIIEESRLLKVSILETLQLNLRCIDTAILLGDIMTIVDEVDSQLVQSMASYLQDQNQTG